MSNPEDFSPEEMEQLAAEAADELGQVMKRFALDPNYSIGSLEDVMRTGVNVHYLEDPFLETIAQGMSAEDIKRIDLIDRVASFLTGLKSLFRR